MGFEYKLVDEKNRVCLGIYMVRVHPATRNVVATRNEVYKKLCLCLVSVLVLDICNKYVP